MKLRARAKRLRRNEVIGKVRDLRQQSSRKHNSTFLKDQSGYIISKRRDQLADAPGVCGMMKQNE